ncbi:MAG TPA: sialidase family protein [Candidatus Binataceae bacterium]|nr:sialidase family protein [Candidatus Binataceae bacterium]
MRVEAPQIEPIDDTMARLRRLENVAGFDPANLSAAGRNLFSLADRWAAVRERLFQGAAAPAAPEQSQAPGAPRMALILGTNLSRSRYSGFTQSQTATAWCGSNVVMGFNDTGAEVTTMASGRGVSMDGYALSFNRGASFTYMGSPATPSDPNTFMSGDPVVECANAATFYYVSSFLDGTNGISGVSLSTSTDGGKTFATPVVIAGQPSDSHIVDGAWIAVDHNTPSHLYVTYTDLDFSGAVCGIEGGSAVPRYAIETVSSADGGMTWTNTPVVVTQVCADPTHPFAFVAGSRVAVGPSGEVYVAWELFGNTNGLGGREIQISKSIDQARSFPSSPATVATIACAGDCVDWQGLIHSNEYPSLAIGKGPHNGMVYLAWNEGNRQTPDALTTTGSYNFTDIMFSQSADAGVTWSTPVRVNNNSEGGGAPLTDQFEPALATDILGRIAICFYDRRRDPANFRIDRFCASSHGGGSWYNTRITLMQFPTAVAQDVLLATDYMGDYDTLASDALDRHAGFVGGFATNITGKPVVKTIQY